MRVSTLSGVRSGGAELHAAATGASIAATATAAALVREALLPWRRQVVVVAFIGLPHVTVGIWFGS